MENAKIVRYLPWPIKGRVVNDVVEKTGQKNGVTYYRVLVKERVLTNVN